MGSLPAKNGCQKVGHRALPSDCFQKLCSDGIRDLYFLVVSCWLLEPSGRQSCQLVNLSTCNLKTYKLKNSYYEKTIILHNRSIKRGKRT